MNIDDAIAVSQRRFRLIVVPLIVIHVVLFTFAGLDILRGTVEGYHNEHLRSLFSAVSGILLCCALISRVPLQRWLLGGATVSLVIQFWLAGYVRAG